MEYFLDNNSKSEVITSEERKKSHDILYSQPPLLEVINIEKEYISKSSWFSKPQTFKAVNDVSFRLYEGETLGLVGESGCGKSTLGNAILQLDKATSGTILYQGVDITKLTLSETRKLRKDIQIIFQDPFASLNPRIPVGKAIMEPMKVHKLYNSDSERKEKVLEILQRVAFVIFVLITVYFLLSASKQKNDVTEVVEEDIKSKKSRFFYGMLLSGLNVFPIPYQAYMTITLASFGIMDFERLSIITYVTGASMGTFVMLYVYIFFFDKIKDKAFTSQKNMNYIIGSVTGLVALITFINILREL